MVCGCRLMVCGGWLVIGRFWLMVGRSWRMIRFLLWIVSSSLIGHLRLVSIVVVSGVLDMLDTAVRKLDRVRATDNIAIRCLSSPEVCLTVIISHSILIGVGLRGVFFLVVDRFRFMVDRFWCMVGRFRFMVDRFWCMVDRFWCMVGGGWGVVHRGRGSMIHWSRGMVS